MDEKQVRQMIREEVSIAKPVGNKKKREPTQWNKFLKECAPTQPKDMAFGDKIRACSVVYQEQKKNLDNRVSTKENNSEEYGGN